MPTRPDTLVFGHGTPLRVTARFRKTPSYRAYRRAVAAATTYEQMVVLLERLAVSPVATDRAGAVLDFAPATDYAARVVNSTAVRLARPDTDPQHHLAARAKRALLALQTGQGPTPKSTVPPLSRAEAAAILRVRQDYWALVRPIWAAADDRAGLWRGVETAVRGRVPEAAAYRQALKAMVLRRGLRQAALVNLLTAWQLRIPVRRVRDAIATDPVLIQTRFA